MNQSSISMVFSAIYTACLSIAFIFFPDPVIALLGFHGGSDAWVRIVGYFLGVLAFYYAAAVREHSTGFERGTVWARVPALLFWSAFVVAGVAPPVLLLWGGVESACGIWTGLALRKERLRHYRELARV
jgi:hypothetical protein